MPQSLWWGALMGNIISSTKRSLEMLKTTTEKKKQKGNNPQRLHHGLVNQGATCYLNSVLQVLSMTTEMHERLDPKSRVIDQELRNIFEKLEDTTCGTENITRSLEIKNVHQQCDAAECLELILCKVSPQASEVFQGQLSYITKCSKGHSINEETNPFWTLPLSLKDTHDSTYSVEKGFERIFQTKSFSGDNRVFCKKCKKKTEATAGCEMMKPPQILTVLLNRFEFDSNTMSHVKSDRCVEVTRVLQRKNQKYKLYGMVNHMGGLRAGHYTASLLFDEDNTWYGFDDTTVNKFKDQPFGKNKTYSSSTVYLLAYRASSSLKDKVEEQLEETSHVDVQGGHKVERKGNLGERSETRKNRKSPGGMREGRNKETLGDQGEEGDAKCEKKAGESVVIPMNKDANYSSTQNSEYSTKANRKQRSKEVEDENSQQPCRSLANIKKKPLWIGLIIFVCVLIVMLAVILTHLDT